MTAARYGVPNNILNQLPDYSEGVSEGADYRPETLSMSTDPETNLANVMEANEKEYQAVYRPEIQKLISDVDSTDLIQEAKEHARGNRVRNRERAERMRMRYGLAADKLARNDIRRSHRFGEMTSYVDSVNNARLNQFDRNTRVRDELINAGRGINTSAINNLGTATQSTTAINNANEQAKAASKAADYQMYGTLASTAIMAAFLA